MTRKTTVLALLAAAAVAPAIATAPKGREQGPGLDELEAECRASGLEGLALLEFAEARVREQFGQHSIWQLWERPEAAMRRGRGWAGQYNLALARLLRRLGFAVQVVHAARVQGLGEMPWWQAGHTWVRVTVDGRVHDATAAPRGGRLVPLTEVRPIRVWTLPTVSLALAPISAYQAWKSLLTGREVPRWMVHDHAVDEHPVAPRRGAPE